MTTKTVNKLPVPGATLHYEVTGSGPVLLLIPGGFTDGAIFDSIVGQLAADYTVITYDPRGNSRSPYDAELVGRGPLTRPGHVAHPYDAELVGRGPLTRPGHVAHPYDAELVGRGPVTRPGHVAHPYDERIDQSAEDALALIDAVAGSEPAYVFGSSSGAITGLELITRHPDRVRMLIAHEPPAVDVLPDATTAHAFFEDVHTTYTTDGPVPALHLFAVGLGLDEDDQPAPEDLRPEYRHAMERMLGNTNTFFAHKLLPFTRYRPDLDALREVAAKIVPASGTDSAEHLPARPIAVIADEIGWPVVTFPGGHTGYASHPVQFATLLSRLLESDQAS
ncbi:alpha/beta hydrolase [Kribbella lupini]|uniref:Alpha/beta hydrolase n=1 Tax=Kribbella lupini TaxID=291602 RepID=A0ABN2BU07_9ACTN